MGAAWSRVVLSSGITAAAAASVVEYAPEPDAELLSLRLRFVDAVQAVSYSEMSTPADMSDEELDELLIQTSAELDDVCCAIVDAPAAQTAQGRALKAAAAMHQLRAAYDGGGWPGSGEEMAWAFLSELAGDTYVPPVVPED